MSENKDNSFITKEYIAKRAIYDQAGYNHPVIPEGSIVDFAGEYQCFYGRFVKIFYKGYIYYVYPEELIKKVTYKNKLESPVFGCSAKHSYLGDLTLEAKLNTDSSDTEYWIAKNNDSILHIIAIKDCKEMYTIDKVVKENVNYWG